MTKPFIIKRMFGFYYCTVVDAQGKRIGQTGWHVKKKDVLRDIIALAKQMHEWAYLLSDLSMEGMSIAINDTTE